MSSEDRTIRRQQIAYLYFEEDYDYNELMIVFELPVKAIKAAIKEYKGWYK